MVKRVTLAEVLDDFTSLLADVVEGEEVEITQQGRLIARIVPAAHPRSGLGSSLIGLASTAGGERALFSTGWNLSVS